MYRLLLCMLSTGYFRVPDLKRIIICRLCDNYRFLNFKYHSVIGLSRVFHDQSYYAFAFLNLKTVQCRVSSDYTFSLRIYLAMISV